MKDESVRKNKVEKTKTWLVHMYQEVSQEMTLKQVEKLLRKHGGSHSWIGDVCHVYILPKVVSHVDLRPWSGSGRRL